MRSQEFNESVRKAKEEYERCPWWKFRKKSILFQKWLNLF